MSRFGRPECRRSRRRGVAVLVALIALGVSGAIASAQTPSDLTDARVAVIGENPGIRLVMKDGAPPSTSINFWRVYQSPAGEGHVCFVTSDVKGDGPTPDDIRLAFADNEKLAEYMASRTHDRLRPGVCREAFSRSPRAFPAERRHGHRVEGEHQGRRVHHRPGVAGSEPFVIESRVGAPHNPYTIRSTFIPAQSADVIINGTRAAGLVTPRMRGNRQSSSAFLAFAETWLKQASRAARPSLGPTGVLGYM